VGCQSIFVQGIVNTGDLFVGAAGLDRTTLAGVYAIIPAATANGYPGVTLEVGDSPNGLNAAEIYLDAEVDGEYALVSIVEQ